MTTKKVVRKKSSTKKKTPAKKRKKVVRKKNHPKQNSSSLKVEKALIENFIALQKVMANMSVKFDSLTIQISKLLELFEISAKALVENNFDVGKETAKDEKESDVVNKVNALLDQNKILARGLSLLHEKTPEGIYPETSQSQNLPFKKIIQPPIQENTSMQGYQKSIVSTQPKATIKQNPIQNNQEIPKPPSNFPMLSKIQPIQKMSLTIPTMPEMGKQNNNQEETQ